MAKFTKELYISQEENNLIQSRKSLTFFGHHGIEET